jgi:transcriptional regulator with XRE-family HTH domain
VRNIKIWRLVSGLSQPEASRRLGMSHVTYGYLERGTLAPTRRHLQKLRSVFGPDADRALEPARSPLEEVVR